MRDDRSLIDWHVSRHFNADITTLCCFRVIRPGKQSSNLENKNELFHILHIKVVICRKI